MSVNKVLLKQKLRKCSTLNEMWAVLDKFYNFDQKFGFLTRDIIVNELIENADKLVNGANIKER